MRFDDIFDAAYKSANFERTVPLWGQDAPGLPNQSGGHWDPVTLQWVDDLDLDPATLQEVDKYTDDPSFLEADLWEYDSPLDQQYDPNQIIEPLDGFFDLF